MPLPELEREFQIETRSSLPYTPAALVSEGIPFERRVQGVGVGIALKNRRLGIENGLQMRTLQPIWHGMLKSLQFAQKHGGKRRQGQPEG